jgi:hypothetical protein
MGLKSQLNLLNLQRFSYITAWCSADSIYKLLPRDQFPVSHLRLHDHLRWGCQRLAHNEQKGEGHSRSRTGQGKLRSYLDPAWIVSITVSAAVPEMYPRCSNEPPGAVGGRYGSGCFHFSSSDSVSLISSYGEASAWVLRAMAARIVARAGAMGQYV